MPIIGLDHVQLAMPVGGEQAAREFYTNVLGIREIAKPPHRAARGGCWFEDHGIKIHLGVESDFRPARKAHPGLIVEGLQALVQKLNASGYHAVPDEPFGGFSRVHVDDPFGNRLELMEAGTAG